jgi:DNA replication protein
MKPAIREDGNMDFLSLPFVTLPYELLANFAKLQLHPEELLVLVQILGALQVEQTDFLEPQEIAKRCGLDALAVHSIVERLVHRNFLSIGVRINDDGTESHYYDLTPLGQRLRGREQAPPVERRFEVNLVSVFEQELGRPLSGLECEQIRVWLEQDGYAEWIVVEALKESIFANKFSIKYIDRVLYDWQRHRILSRPELEQDRHSMRERMAGQNQTASTGARPRKRSGNKPSDSSQDERYSNFYKLFPNG